VRQSIQKIIVSINFGDREIKVGELVQDNKTIYFKYDLDFIALGLEISPFHLPLKNTIYTALPNPFDGLFGVFSDSLPDGWGRMLLDRALAKKGVLIQTVTPLHRLSYVGSKGMGALSYRPEIESVIQEKLQLELDAIFKEMKVVLNGDSSLILEELYEMGGSSGGARPKIVVGYNPETEHMIYGFEILPKGYEHWLIKFPSSNDRTDIAQIEYAYHTMALEAGIVMNPCRLFKSISGKLFFGTKRFDRTLNTRLHLHSAAGLLNDDFRWSTMDYGHLMEASFQLEKDVIAHEKILRLAAFNVFAHNRDDHSKNISYLMDAQGKWQLAPAYDIVFSNSSHGFHSMMISGESKNPTKSDLMALANHFKFKKANEVIEEVQNAVANWIHHANNAAVTKESMLFIKKNIQSISKL